MSLRHGKKNEDIYRLIEGYNSLNQIYYKKVRFGYFSEEQIQALLKALAARSGLDFDEIVGAYAKKKTKIANDLLLVQKDGPNPIFSCGNNPYFRAQLICEDELP